MAATVTEREVPEGDLRSDILDLMCDHEPWILVKATFEGDAMNVTIEVGGGIRTSATIRTLLEKTLAALPG